jgi:hypothetical protein
MGVLQGTFNQILGSAIAAKKAVDLEKHGTIKLEQQEQEAKSKADLQAKAQNQKELDTASKIQDELNKLDKKSKDLKIQSKEAKSKNKLAKEKYGYQTEKIGANLYQLTDIGDGVLKSSPISAAKYQKDQQALASANLAYSTKIDTLRNQSAYFNQRRAMLKEMNAKLSEGNRLDEKLFNGKNLGGK